MISPVLTGGFVEMDRAYCICPISVKRSRSDLRPKSEFDDPIKIKGNLSLPAQNPQKNVCEG